MVCFSNGINDNVYFPGKANNDTQIKLDKI